MDGQTLGHYTILEQLGKGAMGEVYRARDSILGRDVAVKLLPEAFTDDRDRLTRFEREAKLLASLNHPHIAQVHALDDVDGRKLLVMELVEGETLSERLGKGPIGIEEAIRVAIEIAQALEAAHERGIAHRDLKPSNIKLTADGEVKVLDFGLAKPVPSPDSSGAHDLPTLTYAPTEAGLVVGTLAYMSPEQARGEEVDRRTDIWAFGVVLWEMLTGKRLFGGDTASDVLAAVLRLEPEWERLPPDTPRIVRAVLRHCLARDPRNRLHDIADARLDLRDFLDGVELSVVDDSAREGRGRRTAFYWIAIVAAALAATATWFLKPGEFPTPSPVIRSEIQFPEGERLAPYFRHGVSLSQDGSLLAYVSGSVGWPGTQNQNQIYVRKMDRWEGRPLAGTEMSTQPVFSPDGEWLAFISRGGDGAVELRKMPIAGGAAERLCQCNADWGVSWGPDNRVVFGSDSGGLQQVPAAGGAPSALTTLDQGEGEFSHRLPHILPSGEAVLFTVLASPRGSDDVVWVHNRALSSTVAVLRLETGERKLLIRDATDARYFDPGYLVFARRGGLFAAEFDLERLEVVGPEVPLLEGVSHSLFSGDSSQNTAAAQFSVSQSGLLAYAPGSVAPERRRSVAFVDQSGTESTIDIEKKNFLSARLSQDGQRVLLGTNYWPWAVWILDLERSTLARQTFSGAALFPIWGPGRDEFTYLDPSRGAIRIKRIGMEPGESEILISGVSAFPSSWSPDGQRLSVVEITQRTPTDWDWDILAISRDGGLEPLIRTRFLEGWPEFSPDGRWMTYVSNKSGTFEVFLRPSSGPGPEVQLSTNGGRESMWSRDGKEVIYRSLDRFLAVEVREVDGSVKPGGSVELFERRYSRSSPVRSGDITPDGRLILVTPPPEEQLAGYLDTLMPTRIRLVHNWLAEVEEKVRLGE